jgi:septum formation protein
MIILASQSLIRQHILHNAGIPFMAQKSPFDEDTAQKQLKTLSPKDVAQYLAREKANATSMLHPNALVIGADQTLELEGAILHKSKSTEDARSTIHNLNGKTHFLHSAIVISRGETLLYSHVATSSLVMRILTPTFIESYLVQVGDDALTSPGAYQIEKTGAQLFEKIEGDYFSILGIPLLPLLSFLRKIGELPS